MNSISQRQGIPSAMLLLLLKQLFIFAIIIFMLGYDLCFTLCVHVCVCVLFVNIHMNIYITM